MKFIRSYSINIKTPEGVSLTIEPPFSADIQVDRSMRASMNNCDITLYNLSPSTRNRIYKDKYTFPQYWQMSVMAGYGENLFQIFLGNITEAYSYKQNTDWITKIVAYDGSYQINNGFIAESFSSGTDIKNVIKQSVSSMKNLFLGKLGSAADGSLTRGFVALGNPFEVIQTLTNNSGFIDEQTLHVIGNTEVLKGDVFLLDGNNIFETPRRREEYLEVTTIFSPEIKIARIGQIVSAESRYNGQYQIWGVNHTLSVRGDSAGDATTVLSLNAGAKVFKVVS
jgi:hypothetical protein